MVLLIASVRQPSSTAAAPGRDDAIVTPVLHVHAQFCLGGPFPTLQLLAFGVMSHNSWRAEIVKEEAKEVIKVQCPHLLFRMPHLSLWNYKPLQVIHWVRL